MPVIKIGEHQAGILWLLGGPGAPRVSSLRLTLFLQFLDGLPPLGPLVVGGEQEEVAL